MAVGDECTLRIVGRYQDQNIVNTLHYKISTQNSPDNSILQSLCTGWNTEFGTDWAAAHADSYELIGLKAFGKTGTSKTPGFLPLGTAGTVTGAGAPSFACRTITLYSGSVKHRRRGRLMLSGSPVAHFDTDDGSLTAAAVLLLEAIGAIVVEPIEYISDVFTAGLPLVGADPWEDFTDYKARQTPSCVTSRRIRQFLIG